MTRPSLDPRRLARGVAIALALSLLLYELTANLALSTHAIAHLVSEHPDTLRLDYARAHSFWPGRAHVEGLDLRGRDPHLEWELHIDRADADISLLALLRRRFRVAKVVATGITFRARFRLEPGAVDADRVARMPSIDGFASPPIVGVPPDPIASGKPWTIEIRDIDAQAVREVWIDAYRLAGVVHARGEGGFTLGAGHLAVSPATADVDGATLTTGDDPIVLETKGTIDAQLDPVDLGEVQGVRVLRDLTMHATLEGKMGGIRFIRHFLHDDAIALEGGAGTFRSETSIVRGVVQKGTSSRIELAPAAVRVDGRSIEGGVRVEATAGDDGDATSPWTHLDVSLAGLAFTAPNATTPAFQCDALATSVHAAQVDLAEPLGATKGLSYSWDTARVALLDMHAIDDAIPADAPFHIDRGAGTLSTRGRGTLQGASAETQIDAELAMRIWGGRVASGVKGSVPVQVSFAARTLGLEGTDLALSDPALHGWWGKVKLGVTTVHFDPPSITLAVSTRARDARPFLSFYSAMQGTSPFAKTALAIVPDPTIETLTADLHGTIRLAATRGALDLDGLDVQGASSRLRGALKKRGERMDGGLLLEADTTALGISFVQGKTGLVLVEPTKWFETNVMHAAH